jgi:hypothetical protein
VSDIGLAFSLVRWVGCSAARSGRQGPDGKKYVKNFLQKQVSVKFWKNISIFKIRTPDLALVVLERR